MFTFGPLQKICRFKSWKTRQLSVGIFWICPSALYPNDWSVKSRVKYWVNMQTVDVTFVLRPSEFSQYILEISFSPTADLLHAHAV